MLNLQFPCSNLLVKKVNQFSHVLFEARKIRFALKQLAPELSGYKSKCQQVAGEVPEVTLQPNNFSSPSVKAAVEERTTLPCLRETQDIRFGPRKTARTPIDFCLCPSLSS